MQKPGAMYGNAQTPDFIGVKITLQLGIAQPDLPKDGRDSLEVRFVKPVNIITAIIPKQTPTTL